VSPTTEGAQGPNPRRSLHRRRELGPAAPQGARRMKGTDGREGREQRQPSLGLSSERSDFSFKLYKLRLNQ
jgi:hypothetical protein